MTLGLVFGIGASLAIAAGIVVAHLSGPRVPWPKRWPSPPGVGYSSTLSPEYRAAIQEAVTFFANLGHEFATEPTVMQFPAAGFIVFTIPSGSHTHVLTGDHAGETEVVTDLANAKIRLAQVRLTQGMAGDRLRRVVRHELGHALGFGHVKMTGHIMSDDVSKVGDDTRGLECRP